MGKDEIIAELKDFISDLMAQSHAASTRVYSDQQGEILQRFTRMETLNLSQTECLKEIKEQTIKTNGDVRRLKEWRSWMTGGMAAFMLVLVPLFAWVLVQETSRDEAITHAVAQALLPYSKP